MSISLSCCCGECGDIADVTPVEWDAIVAAAPQPVPDEVWQRWADEWSAEHADEPVDPQDVTERQPATMAQLYSQLASVDARAARLELRRTELLGELVAAQAKADLARDLPVGADVTAAQRAAAADGARATVVDSAVAACGGRRGPWLGRAGFAAAPEPIARTLREGVDAGVLTFEQACTLVHETGHLGLPPEQRAALVAAVLEYGSRTRERTGAPMGQAGFRAKLRREIITRAETPQRRAAAPAETSAAWTSFAPTRRSICSSSVSPRGTRPPAWTPPAPAGGPQPRCRSWSRPPPWWVRTNSRGWSRANWSPPKRFGRWRTRRAVCGVGSWPTRSPATRWTRS